MAPIDLGGGYTYFSPATGNEFLRGESRRIHQDFKNPDTQYQSGIDFHADWGIRIFCRNSFYRPGWIWLPADHR